MTQSVLVLVSAWFALYLYACCGPGEAAHSGVVGSLLFTV